MSSASTCPRCGQSNQCTQASAAAAVQHCWCFEAKVDPQVLAELPAEQRNLSCLCPRCAQGLPTTAQPAD